MPTRLANAFASACRFCHCSLQVPSWDGFYRPGTVLLWVFTVVAWFLPPWYGFCRPNTFFTVLHGTVFTVLVRFLPSRYGFYRPGTVFTVLVLTGCSNLV